MRGTGISGGRCCLRRTPFGPVAMMWLTVQGRPAIVRILLSRPGTRADRALKSVPGEWTLSGCAEIDCIADGIEAFLGGEAVRFPLDGIHLDLCSDFQQKVLRAEHGIPRGRVSSYGLIARRIGSPLAARAVGAALAANPFPIIIPCHRAIRADRALGGYQGGPGMKRALLEMERLRFDDTGRVATENFYYGERAHVKEDDGNG
jgi:methylated-DNA-[protein]-cysteine S-methyltransferase